MSPIPPTDTRAGHGIINATCSPGGSPMLGALAYTYPLKLISPSPSAAAKSVIVFLLTYGGGLVSGDGTDLKVTIGAASRLTLLTQGSTKIFKAPSTKVVTSQTLEVVIEGDGALVYLPDPVQPFAESVYEQRQTFQLDPVQGSLCVLDWVCEGRTARGETWDLWRWTSKNELWSSGSTKGLLLLRDNMILKGASTGGQNNPLEKRMNGLGVMGTLIIRGPRFDRLKRFFLHEFSSLPRLGVQHQFSQVEEKTASERWRMQRQAQEKADGVLWTAAAVRGSIVVKFGARNVEGGRRWLGEMLKEQGTLEVEFGEESLLCLR
ncbi:MAG: hypothetical protein M1823_003520 [Watsoniomyces obsoletus]|nr:MAG: hypothetical protein M1823_003520 [Watsoniomyces obsoletus]